MEIAVFHYLNMFDNETVENCWKKEEVLSSIFSLHPCRLDQIQTIENKMFFNNMFDNETGKNCWKKEKVPSSIFSLYVHTVFSKAFFH